MGTNFYFHHNVCKCCKRSDVMHIGKSSGGWCFLLHVGLPDDDVPQTLEAWKEKFKEPNSFIENEYGERLEPDEMLAMILERSWAHKGHYEHDNWSAFLNLNNAVQGPNNLLRSKIDMCHCIGHGDGTYDLIIGEFS
jgi:hypothetical protein